MANKTQLGIGAAIAVIVAAYFGIDLNQQNKSTEQAQVNSQDQTIVLHNLILNQVISKIFKTRSQTIVKISKG
jgi:hypothetical protein